MNREEQMQQLLAAACSWIQRKGWGSVDPVSLKYLFWLEERDLKTIQDHLPARSCRYVLLRVNRESVAQRKHADILICTQHTPSEIIELPMGGGALLRCAGCNLMLFGHQKRYVSRSIYLFDVNAPPYYTSARFCTQDCRKAYVAYLEEHADEIFPHV